MKLTKAIFSANDSFYLEYWPKQAETCKAILGIEPVLFWITEEDSDFYDDGHGIVKKIKKVDWVSDAIQACIVRFWAPLLFPEDTCILCDIDMFMLSKKYFVDSIKNIPEDDLVIYSSDSYDRSRKEMKDFFSTYNLPFEQDMYSVCYNAAKGKTFTKIMNLSGSFEDFLKMVSEKQGYKMSWFVDEFFYSDCVNNTNHGINVHYLKRGIRTPFTVANRIEKWHIPNVHYDIHQFNIDRERDGVYNANLLRCDYYIDFHAPRPYQKYKDQINEICDIAKHHHIHGFNKPKKIALISTFCNTQEKIDILLKHIRKIKQLGIDVMAIGPNNLIMPNEVINECDYFFYTKDNPLLKWPERMYTHWYQMPFQGNEKITTLQRGLADYGWAALYQTKKLSQIALSFDYDIFYHMIYDTEIDEAITQEIQDNNVNIVYPRKDPHHPETLWETTLHFMVFDRIMMEKIEKEITLDNYKETNGVAEGEVLKWKNKFNLKGSDHPVKDLIYYWNDFDFFDYKIHKDFKMFISKNDPHKIWIGENPAYESEIPSNVRIVFHSYRNNTIKEKGINVIINDIKFKINPNDWEIQEFPVNSKHIQKIAFEYEGEIIDFTEEYREIMLNQIYYNHRP